MTRVVLRPMTDRGWLVLIDGNRAGIASLSANGTVKVVGRQLNGTYQGMDELSRVAGGPITIEQPPEPAPEKEAGVVDGFPIKHDSWHNVLTEPVPSYTRTSKSQNRYAAGYYALRFSNGWTPSFCPKLLTLSEHEYIGPFKTKLEMQHQISSKNKVIDV